MNLTKTCPNTSTKLGVWISFPIYFYNSEMLVTTFLFGQSSWIQSVENCYHRVPEWRSSQACRLNQPSNGINFGSKHAGWVACGAKVTGVARGAVECGFFVLIHEATLFITTTCLLRLSITRRLQNSKLNRQMRFSLPSIKCSAAPPSFRQCCRNRDQRFDLITARSTVVGSWEESPIHLIDGSKKRIFRLSFEF